MKNIYGINEQGKLIDIKDVIKKSSEKYFCINCSENLVPKKGEKKAHHFSHKNETDCNFETYLHALSKKMFFDKYNECLQLKKPFFLKYPTKRMCISCRDINIECELKPELNLYDLTKRFDIISIEKYDENFIPDIKLASSKFGDVIFIEFAVTHRSELNKLKSGVRIMEFDINSESDLNFLLQEEIQFDQTNADFHNFIFQNKEDNYVQKSDCNKLFQIFSIYKDGEALIRKLKMSEIALEMENENSIVHEVDIIKTLSLTDSYIKLIKKYSRKGTNIRNCHACINSQKNLRYNQIFPFYCNKLDKEISNTNDGTKCIEFSKTLHM